MILKIVYFGNGKDVIGGPRLHNINGFVIYKSMGDFTWKVSDCEELVGEKITILNSLSK